MWNFEWKKHIEWIDKRDKEIEWLKFIISLYRDQVSFLMQRHWDFNIIPNIDKWKTTSGENLHKECERLMR